MSNSQLLGAARVVVAISTIAALLACSWLSIGHSWIPYLIVGVVVASAIGGWTWRRGTQAIILALGHVWPLLSFVLFNGVEVLSWTVWVAALVTLALATSPLRRWSVPAPWQIPIAAWAVLLALGWPIVVARELDFSFGAYFETGTLNGVWGGSPRDTAALVTGATAAVLSSLMVMDWLWARYGARSDDRFYREVAAPLTIGTVIAIGVGIYQGTVDLTLWNAAPWPGLGRATGTLFDSNAFGALAALWAAPVAGAALLAQRPLLRLAGLTLLIASALAVWTSGSRTALLGLMLSLGGITLGLTRAGRLSKAVSAVAVLTIVLSVGVGWLAGGPGSGLRRVWQTVPAASIEGLSRFASSMWTRDGYGSASVAAVRNHPLTGVGPGAFPVFAPGYWLVETGQMIPPDNAQNWWRHQFTELGLIAGLVPVLCSGLVLASVWRAGRRRDRPTTAVAAGAVTAAGVMSILSSPVANPMVLLTMAIVIFWLTKGVWHSAETAGRDAPRTRRLAAITLVCALPVAWTGATLWTAVTELRPPYRAIEIGWIYAYGFGEATVLDNGAERRWAAQRAVAVIPARRARLILTLRPGPSADGLAVHLRVSTRDQVVLEQDVKPGDIASSTITVAPGQRWVMVQIESSQPGPIIGGIERAVDVTSRFE